jgi:hypothetical protein
MKSTFLKNLFKKSTEGIIDTPINSIKSNVPLDEEASEV